MSLLFDNKHLFRTCIIFGANGVEDDGEGLSTSPVILNHQGKQQ